MKSCQNCGKAAGEFHDGWHLCGNCAADFAEADFWWAEYQAGRIVWNTSQHDPWWRHWLLSRELFDTFHGTAPRLGQKIQHMLGGDVFLWSRDNCRVCVWVAPREVVVAYAADDSSLHELADCIGSLRRCERFELGQVCHASSYGALVLPGHPLPLVMWAQAGDWAALARNQWVEHGRRPAAWH